MPDNTTPLDTVDLNGRVALVTGGARRIGRVLVLALARSGADVVIHCRTSVAEANSVAEEVAALGSRAGVVEGDLADTDTVESLMEESSRAFGPPDILVNNASIFEEGSLQETSVDAWDRHHAVNLRAPFLLAREFARRLPDEQSGDIINLNDWRALRPGADHFAYTSSKVGLHGLTRSLALALAPRIRVNELALGAVLPPERASADYMHVLEQEIPLARFSPPEDVALAALQLLANRSVTGQTICVDGGRNLI